MSAISSPVIDLTAPVTVVDPYDPMGMPIYDGDLAGVSAALVDGSYEAIVYDERTDEDVPGQLTVREGGVIFTPLEG